MTIVAPYSDLHVDINLNNGVNPLEEIEQSLKSHPADVIAIAGDMANHPALARRFLNELAERVSPLPIVYVPGNHDYYGSTLAQGRLTMHKHGALPDNVRILERDVVQIKDVTFFGTTLWYPDTDISNWSDNLIGDLRVQLLFEHEWDRQFLEMAADMPPVSKAVEGGAVVRSSKYLITHMLPSPTLVAERWKDSDTNRFFVSPVDMEILNKFDKVQYGHTHDTKHSLGRFICNPRGYPEEKRDGDFDPCFRVHLHP